MTARDRDRYAAGFADGWRDRGEYQRRRTRAWARAWLDGPHTNDQMCPTCLAGWALIDDDESELLAATT